MLFLTAITTSHRSAPWGVHLITWHAVPDERGPCREDLSCKSLDQNKHNEPPTIVPARPVAAQPNSIFIIGNEPRVVMKLNTKPQNIPNMPPKNTPMSRKFLVLVAGSEGLAYRASMGSIFKKIEVRLTVTRNSCRSRPTVFDAMRVCILIVGWRLGQMSPAVEHYLEKPGP